MPRREEHEDGVDDDDYVCFCIGCTSFGIAIVAALVILVKLYVDYLWNSDPNIYMQDFYVPALDKTTAFNTSNTSVYLDMKFARKAALTRPSYKDFQMTLSYGMTEDKLSPVGTSMIHGFRMGRKKRVDVKAEMGAVGLPWDEAVRVVSNHNDVVFMAVTLKSDYTYVANVMVDASGHMFSKNPIEFI